MDRKSASGLGVVLGALCACGTIDRGELSSASTSVGETGGTESGPSGNGPTTNGNDDGRDDDPIFDVGSADSGGSVGPSCTVVDDMDGIGDCEAKAPPDSFTPAVQWTWTPEVDVYGIVTPLVANLTDDDGDGRIDLCDVPDIVVVATSEIEPTPGSKAATCASPSPGVDVTAAVRQPSEGGLVRRP